MHRPVCFAIACALFVVGCAGAEKVHISLATLAGDGRTLELGVASCGASHTVDVDESADEVRVTVTAEGGSQNDCMDSVEAVLQEGLDDRRLIDGATGDDVGLQGG